eukprot:m.15557 g.15557  ORF g.15557 m.15557 type:complete len:66 (+) comp7871_c0_seq2:1747-1944(+)
MWSPMRIKLVKPQSASQAPSTLSSLHSACSDLLSMPTKAHFVTHNVRCMQQERCKPVIFRSLTFG